MCGCHRCGVVGALCHSSTQQALLRRGPCEDSKPPASMQQVPPVEPLHMSLRALPMVVHKPSSGEPPQGPPQPIAKCVWSSAVPAAAKGGLPPAVRAACVQTQRLLPAWPPLETVVAVVWKPSENSQSQAPIFPVT